MRAKRMSEAIGKQSILVVEDNPLNMLRVHKILSTKDYEVLQATSGEEGLAIAQSERPQLILMDVHLPQMDGYTVTRLLRDDPVTSRIPVIAVTASARDVDRARALEAGCAAFISKPIRLRELLKCVEDNIVPSVAAGREDPHDEISRAA